MKCTLLHPCESGLLSAGSNLAQSCEQESSGSWPVTVGWLWPQITGQASLTHWPLGDLDSIWKVLSSILFYWLVSSRLLMIMPLDECHGTYLKISQHSSGNGSVPSGNEPLPEPMLTKICHHMASLGHNELNDPCLLRHLTQGDPPEILRQTNISLNHGIPSFNCGTALGTKILRENFYFPDFKQNYHGIIPWYIRRNASEQVLRWKWSDTCFYWNLVTGSGCHAWPKFGSGSATWGVQALHYSDKRTGWKHHLGWWFHPTLYWACDCLTMMGLKFNPC